MATLRGAIRSYGAAVRRMEREQQRQAREAAKRFKEQQKIEELLNAKQAVLDWENYVETLQSVHKNCTNPIDWNQIKNDEPFKPKVSSKNEDIARAKLSCFKPSFFDKIFGSTQKKKNKLTEHLKEAQAKDKQEYDIRYKEYLEKLKTWNELKTIGAGIEKQQPEAYKAALEYFDPFSDIGELGAQIKFSFEDNYIDIELLVNSVEVIPDYELKQTSTGKLSKKSMSKARFNELYQDHVCSSTLRIGREIFAYLQVEHVRVSAMAKILNSSTGHLEEQPILSVIFSSRTMESLNLNSLDPSDSMRNFIHNMIFSKTNGFGVVDKVELRK